MSCIPGVRSGEYLDYQWERVASKLHFAVQCMFRLRGREVSRADIGQLRAHVADIESNLARLESHIAASEGGEA